MDYLTSSESRNPSSSFPNGSRRIGDHTCWTIILPPTSHPSIDSIEDYMDSNTWTLHHRKPERGQISAIHLWVIMKDVKMLENTYILDPNKLTFSTNFWMSFKSSEHYGKRYAPHYSIVDCMLKYITQICQQGLQY